MWFKNLIIYQIDPAFKITSQQLEAQLKTKQFSPCGQLQPSTFGWISPIENGKNFIHSVQNCLLFSGCLEEKVLPQGVIRDEMQRRIMKQKASSNQTTFSRQIKSKLKEEIIFDLLPKAFTQKKIVHGYFDLNQNLLIINSPSSAFADMMVSTLRKSIGSLPVTLLKAAESSSLHMTHWLKNPEYLPNNIILGDECELLQPYSKSIVHARNHTLKTEEVMQHLSSGKQVKKLSIEWHETLSCLLDDHFSIKRIKFFNTSLRDAQDQTHLSLADKIDLNFSEMVIILRAFIADLLVGFQKTYPNKPIIKEIEIKKEALDYNEI
ncbi:MAG: recombination-associated protein RdgC [Endozoicomonadaceae bacterium]|nr:recombination-associated protein RdgC [Endozoicomonadaceae bacterium]MBE8232972.1 recombination-associated protein RdgC [Endozoicomonadaceae bacterium]